MGGENVKYIQVVVYLYLFLICGFILSSGIVCAQSIPNSSVKNNTTIKQVQNKGQPIGSAANTTLVVKNYATSASVEKNKGQPIELAANTTGDLINHTLIFTIGTPKHGDVFPHMITGRSPTHTTQIKIEYTPNHNYNGTDSFSYNVTPAPPDGKYSSTGYVFLTVNASPLLPKTPPQSLAALAFAISFIIDFIIFLAAYLIIRELRRTKRMKFSALLHDSLEY